MSLTVEHHAPHDSVSNAEPAVTTIVRKRMARDLWIVGRATVVGQLVALATSVSLRWLLDPTALGIWQSLRLFLSYGNYLNLGASKGASRELSVAIGEGNAQRVTHDLCLAQTVNTLSSLVYGVVLAGLSAWCSTLTTDHATAWSYGLAFLAIFVVLQRQVTFHITLLRAEQRFDATARQSVYEGLAMLALGGVGAWLAGLPGLLIAALLVAIGSLAYLRRCATIPLTWAWDTRGVRRLIAIGSPILLTGVCTTLFRSLDRLALLTFSPQAAFDVGCYSTALLVGAQLYGLASLTGTVTSPKLAQLYGATADTAAVARFAAETTLTQLTWLTPLGAAAVVVGPALLGALFPDYRSGLVALPAVVVGTLLSMIALNGSNALIASSREGAALRGLVIVTVLTALALIGCGVWNVSLAGVALAACLGNLAYAVISGYEGLWHDLPRRERYASLTQLAVAMVPTLSVAIGLELYWPGSGDRGWNDAMQSLGKLAVIGAVAGLNIVLGRQVARQVALAAEVSP